MCVMHSCSSEIKIFLVVLAVFTFFCLFVFIKIRISIGFYWFFCSFLSKLLKIGQMNQQKSIDSQILMKATKRKKLNTARKTINFCFIRKRMHDTHLQFSPLSVATYGWNFKRKHRNNQGFYDTNLRPNHQSRDN